MSKGDPSLHLQGEWCWYLAPGHEFPRSRLVFATSKRREYPAQNNLSDELSVFMYSGSPFVSQIREMQLRGL